MACFCSYVFLACLPAAEKPQPIYNVDNHTPRMSEKVAGRVGVGKGGTGMGWLWEEESTVVTLSAGQVHSARKVHAHYCRGKGHRILLYFNFLVLRHASNSRAFVLYSHAFCATSTKFCTVG